MRSPSVSQPARRALLRRGAPVVALLGAFAAAHAGAEELCPFVVAVDAGHGGSNLGAAGPDGSLEKEVTLALARRLSAHLRTAPGVRVVVCRDKDVLVPIRARARCAAQAGAQLFLSLHANATPPGVGPGTQRGFELYVLPPEEVEEDATLAALGAPGAVGVWAAHLVRAAGARSLTAAASLDGRLGRALGASLSRGIRQRGAALDVLRETGAPSVLVEVGFLDNTDDRATLVTSEGQERVAEALANGVLDFRAAAAR